MVEEMIILVCGQSVTQSKGLERRESQHSLHPDVTF